MTYRCQQRCQANIPLSCLISLMNKGMMFSTKRHCLRITHSLAHGPQSKPHMMRFGWPAPTDQARLSAHEIQMRLAADRRRRLLGDFLPHEVQIIGSVNAGGFGPSPAPWSSGSGLMPVRSWSFSSRRTRSTALSRASTSGARSSPYHHPGRSRII